MSRIRGSPRLAARHTGDQWESGAQFNFDRYETLQFGPWTHFTERVVPQDPRGSICDTSGVFLIKGGLLSTVLNDIGDISGTFLGARDMILAGTRYLVRAAEYGDPAKIRIITHDGTTEVTHDSLVTSTGGRVSMVPWGEDIYIAQEGKETRHQFSLDVPTSTFRNVDELPIGSQGDFPEFIVEFDNNLIYGVNRDETSLTGKIPGIRWSADADPDGFFPAITPGAGNNFMNPKLGPIQGLVEFAGQLVIMCTYGAISMRSTGTLPAFRFQDMHGVGGCPVKFGVAASPNTLFFLGHDGLVRFTQGGPGQILGKEPPRFDPTADFTIDYLVGLDLIRANDYLIDPNTLEYIGVLGTTGTQLAYTGLLPGQVYDVLYAHQSTDGDQYRYTGASASAISAQVRFPDIDFGDEYELLYVDVVTTIEDYLDNPALSVFVRRNDGTTDTVDGELVEDLGPVQRWSVHVVGQVLAVRITAESTLLSDWHGIINVYLLGKGVSAESAGRKRV